MSIAIPLVEILWLDSGEDMEPGWGVIEKCNGLETKDLTATYGLYAGEDDVWLYHGSTYNPYTQEFASRGKIAKELIFSMSVIERVYYEI